MYMYIHETVGGCVIFQVYVYVDDGVHMKTLSFVIRFVYLRSTTYYSIDKQISAEMTAVLCCRFLFTE